MGSNRFRADFFLKPISQNEKFITPAVMASGGRLKTFGEKPKAFSLEENGETYYVGSEVWKQHYTISTVTGLWLLLGVFCQNIVFLYLHLREFLFSLFLESLCYSEYRPGYDTDWYRTLILQICS